MNNDVYDSGDEDDGDKSYVEEEEEYEENELPSNIMFDEIPDGSVIALYI